MRAILSCVVAACAGLGLGACGIKGPLYLPEIPAKPAAAQDGHHSKPPSAPSATQ